MSAAFFLCAASCIAAGNTQSDWKPHQVVTAYGRGATRADAYLDMSKSCYFYARNLGFSSGYDIYLSTWFKAEHYEAEGHMEWHREARNGPIGYLIGELRGPVFGYPRREIALPVGESAWSEAGSSSWRFEFKKLEVQFAQLAESCDETNLSEKQFQDIRERSQQYFGVDVPFGG